MKKEYYLTEEEIECRVNNLSSEELSYIAGIFDGEGCLKLNVKKDGTATIRFEITNTCEKLVQTLYTKVNLGSLYIKPAKNNWRQTYWWIVTSRQSVPILKAIRPWLIVKADQVDVILDYIEKVKALKTSRFITPELHLLRINTSSKLSELKKTA